MAASKGHSWQVLLTLPFPSESCSPREGPAGQPRGPGAGDGVGGLAVPPGALRPGRAGPSRALTTSRGRRLGGRTHLLYFSEQRRNPQICLNEKSRESKETDPVSQVTFSISDTCLSPRNTRCGPRRWGPRPGLEPHLSKGRSAASASPETRGDRGRAAQTGQVASLPTVFLSDSLSSSPYFTPTWGHPSINS